MDSRKLYNHSTWPSPMAVRICKILRLPRHNVKRDSIGRVKKMTHLEALNLLAEYTKMPLEDFLTLKQSEAFSRLHYYPHRVCW